MRQRQPDRRIDELTRLALDVFGVSTCLFYWTDDSSLGMRETVFAGEARPDFGRYRDGIYRWDPLAVPIMMDQGRKVSLLSDCRHAGTLDSSSPFQQHMEETRLNDVMELLFWKDERAIAGLALYETVGSPTSLRERSVNAAALHRFMEFSLLDHPRVKADFLRDIVQRRFGLSPREFEVADLIRCGLSNRDIADELGVSVATVKTHLTRVFEKIGVENRASLVSILLSCQ